LSKDQWKRLKQWERDAQEKHAHKKAHWHTQPQAAAKRGVLVEQTSRGWVVSLPDGRSVGPFRKPKDAWSWVDRQSSRRYRAEFAR
jgi:hypothetical protein